MKVTIISVQAIIASREDCVWTGEVLIKPDVVDTTSDERIYGSVNEHLFRFFNRVDEGDDERLSEIGYRLPSLSVGDVLYWDCKAYKVAGIGFERLTPDALVMGNVFGALKGGDVDG